MFRKKCKLLIDWSQIEASAPGKFVLMGDYGDLYIRNVIAIAIDSRLKVTIRPNREQDDKIRLNLKDFNDIREWPLRLPLFSMTKLVANYADTLVFSETIIQNLRPLLDEKYHSKTNEPTSHNETNPNSISETKNKNSGLEMDLASKVNVIETADEPLTSTKLDLDSKYKSEGQEGCSKPSKDDEQFTCLESVEFALRKTDAREQADMAVMSFLMLYIALGDSFAASTRPSIDIEVESNIPMCRGLGSSTALAVAMCTALMKVFRVSAEPTIIIDWTQTIDRYFHGQTSNLHSSAAVYGGYIYYQHGKVKSVGIPHPLPLKIMLVDTGLRRDPKEVNTNLVSKMTQKLDTIGTMLNTLNELVSQAWRRMNDLDFITQSIDGYLKIAQETMDSLGMGHSKVFEISNLAHRCHLVAKQSQAGETVFLIYDGREDFENVDMFQKSLKQSGYNWLDQNICFEGFKVTTKSISTVES